MSTSVLSFQVVKEHIYLLVTVKRACINILHTYQAFFTHKISVIYNHLTKDYKISVSMYLYIHCYQRKVEISW